MVQPMDVSQGQECHTDMARRASPPGLDTAPQRMVGDQDCRGARGHTWGCGPVVEGGTKGGMAGAAPEASPRPGSPPVAPTTPAPSSLAVARRRGPWLRRSALDRTACGPRDRTLLRRAVPSRPRPQTVVPPGLVVSEGRTGRGRT
jgi:hypothetical protein